MEASPSYVTPIPPIQSKSVCVATQHAFQHGRLVCNGDCMWIRVTFFYIERDLYIYKLWGVGKRILVCLGEIKGCCHSSRAVDAALELQNGLT